MTTLVTEAIILQATDYLESSRLLRLATRDAGVQSVVARGTRGRRSRFGAGLDLFVEGEAHLQLRPGRELQTLTAFSATRVHVALAADLTRLGAAAALAALAVRLVPDEPAPALFELLRDGVRGVAAAAPEDAGAATVGALWRVAAELGVAPTIDACAQCHAEVVTDAGAPFSARVGGMLCSRCAPVHATARRLPAEACAALRHWLAGEGAQLDGPSLRAHQRLLREYLAQHLTDPAGLGAWVTWEAGTWRDA